MSRDDDNEREQVEWVFGLTGGELEDEPWGGFKFNYEGVPDYARSDFADRYQEGISYRTVIGCFLFSEPPKSIEAEDGVWWKCRSFASSGETACPLQPERVKKSRCPLCEAEPGETHGYVYIGDGWMEVVYRHVDDWESA